MSRSPQIQPRNTTRPASLLLQARPSRTNHHDRLSQLEQSTVQTLQAHATSQRWLLPYADMVTLLLGIALLLCSVLLQQQTPSPAKPQVTAVTATSAAAKTIPVPTWVKPLAQKQSTQNSTQIQIQPLQSGALIRMGEGALFAPGSATLTPQAKATLAPLMAQLRDIIAADPKAHIQIEGHTDDTPIRTAQFPSNWELSSARAMQIVQYAIQAHHIPPERLSAAGYGPYHPIAKNSSIQGKQQNRRVDMIVIAAQRP